MKRVHQLPSALFILAVPLFLVTATVAWAFNNPGIYQRGFEKYNISLATGITDADLIQVGAEIRHYFNSTEEPLLVTTRIFGQEQELFNSREVGHMKDVKSLIWGLYLIGILSGVYILGSVALGLGLRRQNFGRLLAVRFRWGGVVTLGILLGVGLFALVGFDTLFLKFHQLSFANDLWQLDPRTDYLVRLFPQNFWFDSTMWVAVRAVTGAILITGISSGFLLYRRWDESRRADSLPTTSAYPEPAP